MTISRRSLLKGGLLLMAAPAILAVPVPPSNNVTAPLYPVIHAGDHGCGKPALYLKRPLQVDELIQAKNVVWPDGHHATTGELVRCGTCRVVLQPPYLPRDGRYEVQSFQDDGWSV